MHLSEDRQSAAIEILGNFRADEVEDLIGRLSALRAQMMPGVPMAPGECNRGDDPAAGRAGGDPCVRVAVMRDGLTRFWVRHEGLGWFGFNLPVERARTLAQYILGLAAPRSQPREFHDLKRRSQDLPH